MPAPSPTLYRSTAPRTPGAPTPTSTYKDLLERVRTEGLLERRTGFYWAVFASLVVATAATLGVSALLGASWFQLIPAGVLGVLFTQFAFLSHEAAHRQIFASRKWNDHAGRWIGVFVVGLSYSWWMNKHNRHHGNPNTIGKDPDIAPDGVVFIEEDAQQRRGFLRKLAMVQGWAFFPLLTLEGANLHWLSVRAVVTGKAAKGTARERRLEAVLLVARFGLLVWFVFAVMPLGIGFAFLAVQMAVFGVMMGGSFAPNHKGMPVIAEGAKIDFFSRQVRTSRNITGGVWVDHLLGGLNHQAEHHLFPSMARPNLRRAKALVREHCEQHEVPYTETSLFRSYGIVVRYLNRVGLAARDPFTCPMVSAYRLH
ncbi:acyl-CoA desaturase [Curtobacterium sp. MCPF17_031]|uniref:fatty acid desaturase family protein n=1 Tax=Curtobacterium sp. MCPF17_031 TaxID=2175653 RepID=UPI000DA879AE|nr:acyl-CoA desaturase [Curtobacterium sp. MCPF17_031]PZE36956.1 acyl-CoA desaturase [Curtobacterium sp. MCPF17_031]